MEVDKPHVQQKKYPQSFAMRNNNKSQKNEKKQKLKVQLLREVKQKINKK